MIVLSLFDGMSCGQIALNRIGIKPGKYYAAEVDKYAIKVTQANYAETIQLGDVTRWREWDIDWSSIDLLIGGSPCQGFSFAGKQLAFDDPRSKLFFVYVDILNHIKSVNPSVKFLLENVKMKKEYLDVISSLLVVEPVFINSALVSAQNRQRYYWANWKVEQPEDIGIVLKDIIEYGLVDRDKSWCIDGNYFKDGNLKSYFEKHRRQIAMYQPCRVSERGRRLAVCGTKRDDVNGQVVRGYECATDGKSAALSTVQKDNYLCEDYKIRKLTPIECERLQTVLQYSKRVEITSCLDQAKSFVDAVEKNPRLLKLVSNAESEQLREYVKLANQNTNASQALKKHIALPNADTQTQKQTKGCTNRNQNEQNLIANNAGNTTMYRRAESVENSAIQSVFMSITEGKTTRCGKEVLRQTEPSYTEQLSGKIALNLSGKETMESANDVVKAIETIQTNRHSISITSFRLSTKNIEQILVISYWFAKSVMDGFTQDTIKTRILYLDLIDGYTNHVSNTQRYKMLGNGWTVDVIAHIFKQINT